MGMTRDCQVVRRSEGTREVMSGLTRLLSSQYQEVRSTARRLECASAPPQIADVACANVPGRHAEPSQHMLLALQQESSSQPALPGPDTSEQRCAQDATTAGRALPLQKASVFLKVPKRCQKTGPGEGAGSASDEEAMQWAPTCEETQGDQHDEYDQREHQDFAQAALPPGLPQRLPVHLHAQQSFQQRRRHAHL